MTDTDLQSKLAECEHVIGLLTAKLQETVDENDRLRAVVAKLTEGTDDAHSTLRRLYLDETQSSNARIRAATAALGVEKPSLKPQPAPLDLVAEPVIPLADLVRRRRARVKALEGLPPCHPRYLEWVNRDGADFTDSAGNSSAAGNGQDDDTGS
jgi:hypothetical protein